MTPANAVGNMPAMKLRIGIAQLANRPKDRRSNLEAAEGLIGELASDGAQLVVLPELFNVGYYFGEELFDLAETLDGVTVSWLREQAAEHQVYITTSIYERLDDHYYNTMVMVGYDGSVQHYRKRNPTWMEFTLWRRSPTPGAGLFETPFGRIGGAICFDAFARETFESLRSGGAQLVVFVSCWATPALTWSPAMLLSRFVLKRWNALAWRTVPEKYAVELGVPVAFANLVGRVRTPIPMTRPWPDEKRARLDMLGKSHVRDAGGGLVVGPLAGRDVGAVAEVDLGRSEPTAAPQLRDAEPLYRDPDYYVVAPPRLAREVQAAYYKELIPLYDERRKRAASGPPSATDRDYS